MIRVKEIVLTKLLIREFEQSDASKYYELASSKEVYEKLGNSYPKSVGEANRMIVHIRRDYLLNKKRRLCICVGDEVVGGISLYTYRDGIEIGYWLGAQYRGQGIATSAVKGLVQYMIDNGESCNIMIRAEYDNKESCAVAKRCNFKLDRLENGILTFRYNGVT